MDVACQNGGMRILTPNFSVLLLVAAISPCTDARTATAAERAACEAKVQQKIDVIDSKMRAGYTAREGKQLRERRHKLETERAECRKGP